MPAIHDSWTGKYNESLFKPFCEATRKARTEPVQVGGDPYKAYKTRLSIALHNVDAAVVWVPDTTAPATYRIGTGFGEVKAEFVQPGAMIPEGED